MVCRFLAEVDRAAAVGMKTRRAGGGNAGRRPNVSRRIEQETEERIAKLAEAAQEKQRSVSGRPERL